MGVCSWLAKVDTPLSNFRFRGSQALQVIPDLDRNKIYLLGTGEELSEAEKNLSIRDLTD